MVETTEGMGGWSLGEGNANLLGSTAPEHRQGLPRWAAATAAEHFAGFRIGGQAAPVDPVAVVLGHQFAGGAIELRAAKPITTPLGKDTPWTRVRGNLIVLGLAFLDGTALTIDIDDGKLAIATMA